MDKQGTGEVFAEIDCGELGTLRLKDDGDRDSYTYLEWIGPDGDRVMRASGHVDERTDYNDGWVQDRFENGGEFSTSKPVTYNVGSEVCDDCGLTWPKKKLEDGECPKCRS